MWCKLALQQESIIASTEEIWGCFGITGASLTTHGIGTDSHPERSSGVARLHLHILMQATKRSSTLVNGLMSCKTAREAGCSPSGILQQVAEISVRAAACHSCILARHRSTDQHMVLVCRQKNNLAASLAARYCRLILVTASTRQVA